MKSIWNAFDRLKPVEFIYRDARGIEKKRMVDTYGMFTHGTHSYLVGFDHDAEDLRTFAPTASSPRSTPPTRALPM